MTGANLTLEISRYHCEECVEERQVVVEQLIRMIPKAAIMNGQLVGDEYWCCPVCYRKKFPVRKKKAGKAKPAATDVSSDGDRKLRLTAGKKRVGLRLQGPETGSGGERHRGHLRVVES